MNYKNTLDSPQDNRQKRAETLAFTVVGGILLGALIGASIAWISQEVCPEYFLWKFTVSSSSVAEEAMLIGGLRGALYGFIFSSIYAVMIAIITKSEAKVNFVFKQVKWFIPIVYACWLLGGLLFLGINYTKPLLLDSNYYMLIQIVDPQLRLEYIWVLGSIKGGTVGGLGAILFGIIRLNNAWQKELRRQSLESKIE
ncbi:MAG: hypothetical protein AAF573_12425 [Bacteroidota bacterium]